MLDDPSLRLDRRHRRRRLAGRPGDGADRLLLGPGSDDAGGEILDQRGLSDRLGACEDDSGNGGGSRFDSGAGDSASMVRSGADGSDPWRWRPMERRTFLAAIRCGGAGGWTRFAAALERRIDADPPPASPGT